MFQDKLNNVKRLKQIVQVLFKYELGFILERLKLKSHLSLQERLKAAMFEETSTQPEKIRKIFEELGATFIKLGQLLSLRPDLVPHEYCEELKKLQDKVDVFPTKNAKEIIRKELGSSPESIFREFDETPIASASVGQVYKAKLKSGEDVIVKVQRPGIKELFDADLAILGFLAQKFNQHYGTEIIDAADIVQEFKRYTYHELDYLQEANNVERFYKNFKREKDVVIPKVYWKYVTQKVLVLEYIKGHTGTETKWKNVKEKKRVAERVANIVFKQIFIDGFLHADPHPGNIFFLKNKKIGLLDFGIVGHIDRDLRGKMGAVFSAMIMGNLDRLAKGLEEMNLIDTEINSEVLKEDLYDTLGEYYNVEISKVDFGSLFYKTIDVAKKDKIRLPSNLVLLGKSLLTVESFCSGLNPSFNIVNVAKPFVEKELVKRFDIKEAIETVGETGQDLKKFITELPKSSEKVIRRIEEADKRMGQLDSHLQKLTGEIDRSANRVVYSLIVIGMLIGSVIAYDLKGPRFFGMSAVSFVGFMTSLVLLLMIFGSMMSEKRLIR